MRHPLPLLRWLGAAAILIALSAIASYAMRSLDTHLWMDEQLTIRLVAAESLPKLWSGIALGIDGNPPLYLTLAWLIAHATPDFISTVAALRTANILIVMVAVLVLYRISLRGVSRLAAYLGTFLFAATNATLVVLAFDLRTYAIYFMLAALSVLLQQRLIERTRRIDAVWLALSLILLVLSHNFGVIYAVCIAAAGLISRWDDIRDRRWASLKLQLVAVIPALFVFACWMPVFALQSETGQPYLWIDKPDIAQLRSIMFTSPTAMWLALAELVCLIGAAVTLLRTRGSTALKAFVYGRETQFARYVVLLCLGISGITVAIWTVSLLLFPIFVPRYFVPQAMVGFALHVAFCELLVRVASQRLSFDGARLAGVAAVVLPVLFGLTLLHDPDHGREPCTDANNRYFEDRFVDGALPVMTESPHVFLPRVAYAARPAAYRFALDWNVVLTYPERSRRNATEFHVMERLKAWQPEPSIKTTEAILRDYPEFLVIEQSGQAWFENLRQTTKVSATKLAEVSGAVGGVCTLWKVTDISARQAAP